MNEIKMMTREEVAEALRVSLRKVDYLIADGELAHTKIGRRVLVSTHELERYVRNLTRIGKDAATA